MTVTRVLVLVVATAVALGVAAPAMAQKTVTLIREIDTDRYDPHKSTARSAAEVLFMVGDTLVALDYDLKKVVPGLAKSWTVSKDGLTYTFKLRDDVTFCSGKKLTAKDVVASYERWMHPDTKAVVKWRAGELDRVVAVDDHTVDYKLKRPFSELLYQMTQHFHVIVDAEQAKQLGQDFGVKAFNGTGPFCLESWTPRDQTVLVKHAGYKWGPPIYGATAAQVDRVIWRIVPEENTRVQALKTGQADASQYVPYWALKDFQADKRLTVTKAENYFWTYFIGFKIDRELVQDVRVRKAMNLAVDQKAITNALTFGYAEPANSYIHPSVLDFDKGMKLDQFGENVEIAKKLLDEAGWKMGPDGFRYKAGKKLAPLFYGFTNAREWAEAVQGDLRKVGIDFQIQLFDATVAWGKIATQEYDAFGMSYPYVSAGDALNLYFRSANIPVPNRMNWRDPDTDQWLAAGSAALTAEERFANYSKVQRKVHDAVVWIPLYHEPLHLVVGPKLRPMRAHGIYGAGMYKGLDLAFR
jgi:peptide/nickel transport system substrate-binding protein